MERLDKCRKPLPGKEIKLLIGKRIETSCNADIASTVKKKIIVI